MTTTVPPSLILLSKPLLLTTTTGIFASTFFTAANFHSSFHGIPTLLLPSASPTTTSSKATDPSSSTQPSPTATTDTPATSPSHLATQRQHIYDLGVRTYPPFAGLATLMFGYAAYTFTANPPLPLTHAVAGLPVQTWLFALAALLNLAAGPFTVLVMAKCNGELERRSKAVRDGVDIPEGRDGESEAEKMTTAELVRWWGRLNAVRACLPMAGAGLAMGVLML